MTAVETVKTVVTVETLEIFDTAETIETFEIAVTVERQFTRAVPIMFGNSPIILSGTSTSQNLYLY